MNAFRFQGERIIEVESNSITGLQIRNLLSIPRAWSLEVEYDGKHAQPVTDATSVWAGAPTPPDVWALPPVSQ